MVSARSGNGWQRSRWAMLAASLNVAGLHRPPREICCQPETMGS
jgi:hypothetical protein